MPSLPLPGCSFACSSGDMSMLFASFFFCPWSWPAGAPFFVTGTKSFEQHPASVEHIAEDAAAGFPVAAGAFKRRLAAGNYLVAIQQRLAAGGVNFHREQVDFLAQREFEISGVEFGGLQLRLVAAEVG